MPKQKRQRRRTRPTLNDAAGGGATSKPINRRPFCFYLLTTADLKCTYGGIATDFARRLNEQNGLSGNDKRGAKHTRMLRAQGHGLLQPVLVVTGFTKERSANSLEAWFHDQRRSLPKWNKHQKMAVRPQDLDIVDETVSQPIRKAIALLLTLLTEHPDQRFKDWELTFQFHLKAAQPLNFSSLFPASCSLSAL